MILYKYKTLKKLFNLKMNRIIQKILNTWNFKQILKDGYTFLNKIYVTQVFSHC